MPSMIDSATLRRNVRALLFVIRLDLTITTPFRSPFEFMRWHASFVFFITHSLVYYVCRSIISDCLFPSRVRTKIRRQRGLEVNRTLYHVQVSSNNSCDEMRSASLPQCVPMRT